MTATAGLPPGDAVVAARGVRFWFGEGELRKQILFHVDFDIRPGKEVILLGQSGSGRRLCSR